MNRKEIILQILGEASGWTPEQTSELLKAMIDQEVMSDSDLDVEFSEAESRRMLEEFREELPGIRRWLTELGFLQESGHA